MAPFQDNTEIVEDPLRSAETPIQQFYKKKSIFVTGATGFLGKILMEKLLRSCDVENIYILARNKKGDDINTRIEKIFNDPLFDAVKRVNPKCHHKIVPITGDCELPGLGISDIDRATLIKNIHIVFHVAATVRFTEKLKLALSINVRGTKAILTLSKEMENLKAFVHVSTAYANSNRMDIGEQMYTTSLSGESAIKLAETLDDETLDEMTPKLLENWPNTYTFTKALAEDYIKSHSKGLPLAVFRPAIVTPTYKQPLEGWIDNLYGPTGIVIGVSAGLLRVLYIEKENNAEIVPVDLCVNSLIAAAYDVGSNSYEIPPVYNYVTSSKNPITWDKYTTVSKVYAETSPLTKTAWFLTFTMSNSKSLVTFLTFWYHVVPASFIDLGRIISGKKPKLLKIYRKIHSLCDVLSYFTNSKFKFSNNNVKNLWSKLDSNDKKLFYFDMDDVNWSEYLKTSMFGVKKYLMKENPADEAESIARFSRLKYLHYTLVYSIRGVSLFFFYKFVTRFLTTTS